MIKEHAELYLNDTTHVIPTDILIQIRDLTSFLKTKSIKNKVYCIVHELYDVPICKMCDIPVKFVHQGGTFKYRQFCSSQCKNDQYESDRQERINEFGEIPSCKMCDTLVKFDSGAQEYRIYCSTKCRKSDMTSVVSKIKETNLKKYGTEIPQQLSHVKEKTKQTNLKRHGVEWTQQNEEIREKSYDTNLKKYGVAHPIQNIEIKEKTKQTNLKRYGVENYKHTYIKDVLPLLQNRDWLYDQHITQKKTMTTIANEYLSSSDHSVVFNYLKKHNIDIQYYFTSVSSGEKELSDFVSSLNVTTILNTRSIITPYELDIYLPEYNIAIEYNGLFWHSEKNKKQTDYHLNKTKLCENKGIRLIHIFEDEWIEQQQKCKDTIIHLLGKSERGVYARNTTIQEITWKEAKDFLNKYHLLNAGTSGKYRIGAFNNNNLIGVMVFGQQNNEGSIKGTIELKRFVTNKKNNPGLGSKMFKYAVNQQQYSEVIAFVDRRWFTGLVKSYIGFTLIDTTIPALWWTDGKKRYYRRFITKQQLIKEGFDPKLSKRLILDSLGYYRIWDCGKLKLQWKIS